MRTSGWGPGCQEILPCRLQERTAFKHAHDERLRKCDAVILQRMNRMVASTVSDLRPVYLCTCSLDFADQVVGLKAELRSLCQRYDCIVHYHHGQPRTCQRYAVRREGWA